MGGLVGLALLAVLAAQTWRSKPSKTKPHAAGSVERAVSPAQAEEAPDEQAEPARAPRPGRSTRLGRRLSEFRADCWQADGEQYDGQPISKLSLVVPSDSRADVPFDFCIDELQLDDTKLAWGDDGQIAADNPFGLAGVWFPYGDQQTFWSLPAGGKTFEGAVEANQPLCVRGRVARSRPDAADSWGAAIGIFLNKVGENVGLHTPKFSRMELQLSGLEVPNLRLLVDDDEKSGRNVSRWCSDVKQK